MDMTALMFASNWGHKGIDEHVREFHFTKSIFHLEFKSLFLVFSSTKKRGVKKFEPKRLEEEKRMFVGSNFRRENTPKLNSKENYQIK